MADDEVVSLGYAGRARRRPAVPDWVLHLMWVAPAVVTGGAWFGTKTSSSAMQGSNGPDAPATGIILFLSGFVVIFTAFVLCIAWLVWTRGRGLRGYVGILFVAAFFWCVRGPVLSLLPTGYPGHRVGYPAPRELDPKTGEPSGGAD